ncbi:hypothetical protein J2Z35_002417 [Acetoanaerobium pronyense]|uniref:Bacteriocin-protection, YdeI or OmpD-Associated n=1 Tax=Acetoanaerobium pronyense TaxID=1482736 RepID=A0ABS4KLC1_9FIRM|nr:YdeI/OmpD-associated family protein [Acetoanaerobium pronyense]MBP2028587.1 hypothetical protein [Acetoanaerobium pronyense]
MMDFKAEVLKIKDWKIIRLPEAISQRLSSRGMVMAEITISKLKFEVPLEPDGMGGHWFRLNESLCEQLDLQSSNTISLSITPLDTWVNPEIPKDLSEALDSSKVRNLWDSLTPKARWEWIRWIRFTENPQTRQKRIKTACSMLESGKKRPCCFDHSRCTETYVSKQGILMTEFSE